MIKNFFKIVPVIAAVIIASSSQAVVIIPDGSDIRGSNNILPAPPSPIPDTAQIQSVSSYNNMDALFGIRVTSGQGATFDAIIDLGSVSQFNHTFTLSLGDIGGFMSSNFGSDWYTRIDPGTGKTSVQWAVVAGDFAGGTDNLWSTRNPAIRATPWGRNFSQGDGSSSIDATGSAYSGNTIASGTTSAVLQSASAPNSWASYQPGGANYAGSFKTWNPTDEGSTNTTLAFDAVPTATGQGQVGTTLGTFTWNQDGTITFTVVPEPSTYQLMALGAIGLIGLTILHRRRALRA